MYVWAGVCACDGVCVCVCIAHATALNSIVLRVSHNVRFQSDQIKYYYGSFQESNIHVGIHWWIPRVGNEFEMYAVWWTLLSEGNYALQYLDGIIT